MFLPPKKIRLNGFSCKWPIFPITFGFPKNFMSKDKKLS